MSCEDIVYLESATCLINILRDDYLIRGERGVLFGFNKGHEFIFI